MDSTFENSVKIQKSYSTAHCTIAEGNPTSTLEITQSESGQITYCRPVVLKSVSVRPQVSNVHVLEHKNVILSGESKVNTTHQPSESALGSKPVQGIVKITKVSSSTDKVGSLTQSITINSLTHSQPKTSNIFDSETDIEPQSTITREVRKHSSSDKPCSQPSKIMKTTLSTPTRNHQSLHQEPSKNGMEYTSRVKISNFGLSSPSTKNYDVAVLRPESEKNTRENRCRPKKNEKTPCKSTGRSNKMPNFPVPANINQYGDSLKTKAGLHSYGLTMNDPPCQFFRGVLKGTSGQTLAVMFGDTNLFSMLEQLPKDSLGHFAIDTTYRLIPDTADGVKNVLAIIFLLQNKVIPVWYAVTSCSSPELYKRIILEFQQYLLDCPFTSVLLNDDPALIKAVKAIFPNIEFYGSWYHYCFSIWNEVRANNLAEECKFNAVLMKAVKMLMVIPFLPSPTDTSSSSNTMVEGLQAVEALFQEESLPTSFQNVLDYVQSFWFNKVKCENITLYNEKTHIRPMKHIELFHIGLLSFLKPDENIWTLTNQFRSLSKEANIDVARYVNGKPMLAKRLPRRKHIVIRSDTNFNRLVKKQYGVETFLDNSASNCDEFFDIILHPMYPTTANTNNISEHVEGWKIK